LFARDLGTDPTNADPHYLAEAMRQNARPRFMAADAGMTGANFAVAETGGFVVCTNEGNADIGTSVPPLHVASIGIEKLIPRARDSASSSECSRGAPWARRSRSTRRTSTAPGGVGSCTW